MYLLPGVAAAGGTTPSDQPKDPFLKWAGGKRWLFRRYRHLFPSSINRLVDPFVGGGSSLFSLAPRSAAIADTNGDLITTYRVVANYPIELADRLSILHTKHSEEHYYNIRAERPDDDISIAAWFLYLNRTCWNGLFRVNRSGRFNVPLGTKTKVFVSRAEFVPYSRVLKNIEMSCQGFELTIESARPGDVIFADPPYFENHSNARFVKYTSAMFSWSDQVRLKERLVAASNRGVICYLTNSNHRSLLELYEGTGEFFVLPRTSIVSGKNIGRRVEHEIMVKLS